MKCPFRINSLPPYYAQADGGCHADGATDDAAHLETAMDAALAAGKHLYLEPGTYLVSTHITPPGGLTMRGAGDTSIIKRTDPDDYTARVIVYLNGANNVSIKNLKLLSTSHGYNANMRGITANTCTGLLVDGVTFSTMERALHADTACSYFTVQNCTTENVKQGFYLKNYSYGTFYNLNVAVSSEAPHGPAWPHHFYIDRYVTNCTFDTITMSNSPVGEFANQCQVIQIYPGDVGNLTFTNITFSEIRCCAIIVDSNTGPIVFDGVTGSTSAWEGSNGMWLWLANADYVTLKNFTIAGDTGFDDYLCYSNTAGTHNTIEGTSSMTSSGYTANHGCLVAGGMVKPTIVGSVTVT